MLADALVLELTAAALVFARVGGCIMVLPAFGEAFVSPRIRLAMALAVTLVLVPVVGTDLRTPLDDAVLVLALLQELLIGAALGLAARFALAAMNLAGTIIALQSALAAAAFFDPHEGTQSAITSNFLTTAGLTLLLVVDGHHYLLAGLAQSFSVAPQMTGYPAADFADLLVRASTDLFVAAVRIAAPVILVTTVINLTFGFFSRLVPGIQVFFIALPLQVLAAIGALLVGFAAGARVFLAGMEAAIAPFAG